MKLEDGRLTSITLRNTQTGEEMLQPCTALVLACGHSARDTFELVRDALRHGAKAFSMGVRIEHPQALINETQWGSAATHPALGAAEYKLAIHLPSGRSVYSFCMCPGGEVVAAASEAGGIVTNGMSNYARDGKNANAALLVNVDPADLASSDVLAGVELQRAVEQRAYRVAQERGERPIRRQRKRSGRFLAKNTLLAAIRCTAIQPTNAAWSKHRSMRCCPISSRRLCAKHCRSWERRSAASTTQARSLPRRDAFLFTSAHLPRRIASGLSRVFGGEGSKFRVGDLSVRRRSRVCGWHHVGRDRWHQGGRGSCAFI